MKRACRWPMERSNCALKNSSEPGGKPDKILALASLFRNAEPSHVRKTPKPWMRTPGGSGRMVGHSENGTFLTVDDWSQIGKRPRSYRPSIALLRGHSE